MNNIIYVGGNKAKKSIIGLEYLFNNKNSNDKLLVIFEEPEQNYEKKKNGILKRTLKFFLKKIFNNYNIKLNYNSLKEFCENNNIKYLSVKDKTLLNCKREIEKFNPDYLLVNGWGWKINIEIINLSKKASLNCHSSYLPYYRGASVYFHVLMNKESYTGITVHKMTDKFDKGYIIKQKQVLINKKETPNSLLEKLAKESGPLLLESIKAIDDGEKGFLPKEKGFYVEKINYKKYIINKLKNEIRILCGRKPKKYCIKTTKKEIK
ncbi:hypothetical protein CN13_06515 [Petrotoga sp. HKA.pet.4.5]|uniref:formyltransferase family protein n=1 Tax=Petrotoga sp. HKA.pet.4.5 TaxID=1473155 RepID=UPI000EF1748B|nr:formyltransferase family protein [Petrotoga sp. HKA.pet.4.5]RLL89239.1 hypothetical protein CN13_06515 [Petrotoga sp. HKA.pet.4.5]